MTSERLVQLASGLKIAVKILGNLNDPIIMFCNGSIFNYVQFEHTFVPQLIKLLDESYCIVLYDYIGYGNSSLLEGQFDFVLISDQHKELMDALKIEKAHLFGYSKGAIISQIVAAKFPDRVISIAGYGNPNLANPESNAMAKKDFGERLERVNKLEDIYDESINNSNVNRVYETVYIPHIFGKKVNELNVIEKIKNYWIKSKLKPMMMNTQVNIMDKLFRYYMRDISEDEEERYIDGVKSITCPVLLMHGTRDETVPISSSKILDKWIINSKLVILENYKHSQPILIPWEGKSIMKKYIMFLESLKY